MKGHWLAHLEVKDFDIYNEFYASSDYQSISGLALNISVRNLVIVDGA